MGKIANLVKRLEKFNPDEVLQDVLKDTKLPEQLVKDRLNKTGTRSTGQKIKTKRAKRGVYANATIFIKMRKGQPYDRVTLKDTGEFQKSFEKKLLKDAFQITGNSDKKDGMIEDNIDFENVLNLSTDENSKLVKEIRPDYVKATRKAVGF